MRSFSWESTKDSELIKYIDYSIFEHNTSTIDQNFYQFFNLSKEDESRKSVVIIDNKKNQYEAYIRHETGRKLIKWNKDFTDYLKNQIPEWRRVQKGDKSSNHMLVFLKSEVENVFNIKVETNNTSDFSDLLLENNIIPSEVQLIRHFGGLQNDMAETYYMLWKNNSKEFDIQTAWQRKNKFQDRKYVAVFVATPTNETLFAKFYKINGQNEKVREDGLGYFYNLNYDNLLQKYEGRLKIDWGKGSQAWAQIGGNTEKPIITDGSIRNLSELTPGKSYIRTELHNAFGGNQRRGIVQLPNFNAIFLLPSLKNENAGYEAQWDDGIYHLSGEGLTGDQKMTVGNKALAESLKKETEIYLFEPLVNKKPFTHKFHSKVKCISFEEYLGPDQNNDIRKMFRFYFKSSEHPDFQNTGYSKIKEEIKEELEEDYIKEPSSTSISTSERILSTEEYKVARKEAVTRRQLENILVAEYKNFLEKEGYKVKHSQVDLIAENDTELIYIEAKILKNATTAAHGLGQLLHYDYILEDKADRLILLFDKKPNSQTARFIMNFKVEIVYRDSNKFESLQ